MMGPSKMHSGSSQVIITTALHVIGLNCWSIRTPFYLSRSLEQGISSWYLFSVYLFHAWKYNRFSFNNISGFGYFKSYKPFMYLTYITCVCTFLKYIKFRKKYITFYKLNDLKAVCGTYKCVFQSNWFLVKFCIYKL